MAGIELVVVFAVAALDLTIVAWSIGTNELVTDAEFSSSVLKQSRLVF